MKRVLAIAALVMVLAGCAVEKTDLRWYIERATWCCEGDESACRELLDAGYELPECR